MSKNSIHPKQGVESSWGRNGKRLLLQEANIEGRASRTPRQMRNCCQTGSCWGCWPVGKRMWNEMVERGLTPPIDEEYQERWTAEDSIIRHGWPVVNFRGKFQDRMS